MQPFLLLRLPFVVLANVLKCLNPIELFTLSQCSTKTIAYIKLARTQKFRLSVDFRMSSITINENYYFKVFEKSTSSKSMFKKIPFKKSDMTGCRIFGFKDAKITVPVTTKARNKNVLISFWDDKFDGLRSIYFHLSKIFGCKVDTFVTGIKISASFRLIEEILEKQSEILNLDIFAYDCNDEDLKWILDTVKVTKKLEIFPQPSENFIYNFKTLPEVLIVHNSSWLTFDDLLSLNSCKVIELISSTLTNKNLDEFMKLWKSGKYPKLEYLSVWNEILDDETPIDGLTVMRNTKNPTRREKRVSENIYSIHNGVDIQSDDGIMATIELDAVCGYFEFLVWTN